MPETAKDREELWALAVGFDRFAYRAMYGITDALEDLETALVLELARYFRDADEDDQVSAASIAHLLYTLRPVLSEAAKIGDVIEEAVAAEVDELTTQAAEDLKSHVDYLLDDEIDFLDVAIVAAVIDSIRETAKQRAGLYGQKQPQFLLADIRSAVADGVGKTVEEFRQVASKRIPSIFKSAKSRADRIATTEAATTYSVTYKSVAVAIDQEGLLPETVYYRWDAVRDKKTCALCRSLDGKIVGVADSYDTIHKGQFESYMYPPAHSWCRCVLFITFSIDEADTRTTTR